MKNISICILLVALAACRNSQKDPHSQPTPTLTPAPTQAPLPVATPSIVSVHNSLSLQLPDDKGVTFGEAMYNGTSEIFVDVTQAAPDISGSMLILRIPCDLNFESGSELRNSLRNIGLLFLEKGLENGNFSIAGRPEEIIKFDAETADKDNLIAIYFDYGKNDTPVRQRNVFIADFRDKNNSCIQINVAGARADFLGPESLLGKTFYRALSTVQFIK